MHKFTTKDLERISRSIDIPGSSPSELLNLIDSLTEKMLAAILGLVGQARYSGVVLLVMKRIIQKLYEGIRYDYHISAKEEEYLDSIYEDSSSWV